MQKLSLVGCFVFVSGVWLSGCASSPANVHQTTRSPSVKTTVTAPQPAMVPTATAPSVLNSLILEDKRAGYFVNGAHFSDANGEVLDLCRFSDTGFVTYTLGDSDVIMRKHTYAVKMRDMRHPNLAGTKLGVLVREPGTQWIYKTADGQQVEADWYRLQSRGLLLVRNRNQVNYVGADGAIRNYPLPPGFVVSSYQEWDIAATRRLLIVNVSEQAQKGKGEVETGLLDLDSGKVGTLLSFAVRDKSEVDQQQYVRSVFSMVNTGSGPVVIAVEDQERRVVVRSLASGAQTIASENAGAPWRINTGSDHGKIWLNAQQGQAQRRIADLEAFLSKQLPAQAAN